MSEPLDPITAAVVEHALHSVTDEMGTVVVATAYSPLVRDLLDFTVALCTPKGEMVVQGVGMAIHLGALPSAIDSVLARLGDDLRPGDAYIMNDTYSGGQHLPNVIVMTPLFVDNRLLGFSVVMIHHTDMGGHVPGSVSATTRDIFGEGLRIPPMILERAGERDRTLIRMIEKNTRLPRDFFGDLDSQLSACRAAERRFAAVVHRYGGDTVLASMHGLLDRSERMARAAISAMPDGSYSFEDWLDNDGLDGPPQRICVTVTIKGDELTADFTGSAKQVPTAINSTYSYTRSAFYLTVRSLMAPEVPNTAGFFRPLHLIAPEGTIINPAFPGAVGAMGLTGYRLTDTLYGALAQAVPGRVRAASEGGTTRFTFAATVDGQASILSEALVGAWGGHSELDGIDGVANIAANMANAPVEMEESTYPVMVEEYALQPDSEGPGRRRGGLGVRRRVRILSQDGGILQLRSGRATRAPWGTNGGLEGTVCQNLLNPGTPKERKLRGLETMHIPGDTTYLHVTPGAGGYGDPKLREPERVAADVRDEKISPQRARDIYRVAVSASGEIDVAETKKLRA